MTLMSLLGHDNITLVDLTEALPSSLSLSSSLSTNVQMVGPDGSYTPDFTTDEVIITPSFFIGSTEIPVADYLNLIYYHCGEMDGNQEKDIAYDASIFDSDGALIDETTSIYVDSLAQLHYRKNLIQNIEIEAFISGFIYNNITYPLARTINPINILRLEYNDEAYSAFMTTEDGREHFEEGQENDITLVAQIYQGAQEVTNVTYAWYQVGSSGLETLPDTTKTLTVARGQIDSTGTFICDITAPNGTVYRISKTLTDRTDSYFGTISANSSLILTPEHSTVTLTNQIWHRTSIINDPDSSRFTYAWSCIDEDNQVVQLTGVTTDEKSLVVDINGAFPKKDLVIYCEATIDGKAITNSYISLSYSPITYSVYVEPRTIFVPANANGSYRGETSFSKEIKFQLLNDAKEPLTFGEEDTAPSLVTNPIFAASITQVTEGKWDYLITLTIQDTAQFQNGFNDSYSLAFTYEYLGVAFSEEVEAIKNISGSDGEEGSGYTVILTNESFVFPANNSAAIAGAQGKTSVMAFRNTTPLAATITSINNNPVSGNTTNNSGLVSNMDVTITGNGTTSPQITFAARPTLTNSGTIPIIISTSGGSFTKIWSYSLSFRGIDGSNGTTLTSSVVTYQVSANGNNPPSGEWLTSIPSIPEGQYLWTRTVVTYSDGTETASYSVSKNGEKGQSGTSVTITSTEIEYAVSTSGTVQPSSGWQTTLPSVESGSYLWTRTTVNYSDGTNTVAYSVAYQGINGTDGADGANGEDGVGLASSLVEYTVSSNGGPTPPSSGWETTIPILTPGQYLWTRLTITYTDQTTTTSYSVSREGVNGQDGQDGQNGTSISILSQTVHYQYSNNGSTPPSGTWLETVPPTELGKYLWTRTEVSYSDGTTTTSYSVAYQGIDGQNGQDGTSVTIEETSITYQVSTSGTTQPSGDWLSSIPEVDPGEYLWTRTYILYSNGESLTSFSVARQGNNGQNGQDGTSITITSTSIDYQISTDGINPPSGTWNTNIPSVPNGQFLWTRTIVNYSDGSSTTSYSVSYQGTNGTDGANGTDGRTYSVIANSDYIVYQVKNGVPSMTPATLTLNAYTYIGTSTVPTPFSGGTLTFFGRNVYNSWVELSSIAGATLSVNLNQTNFYPYKEFKYQLRTEDYILDEQTIPVLRDGILNGGRNLIIGSDNTWTRDFDDTGKLEFSLNVTRNIAYSEYQGQYLTLSFDRVFSPTAATMCSDVDDADKDEDGNAPFGALVRVTWSNGSGGQVVHEYCEANYHPDMTEDNTQRYMTTDWIEPPETGYSISLVEVVIQLAYYPNSSGMIFSITRPQLEFGFDASAWTIAPEDLSLETIKGLNLITNSYRYSVDSSIALYNSIEIPADDDYILSWQNVERAPIITENELITVEVVDAIGSVLSTQNITVFNSPGSILFENLSMGEFIRIYCGNKSTITVSDNSVITFTQIKLERGRNATSWLASDSDIIQIVQQIQEDTANEIGAASDAVLNIIQEDGTIVRTTMDDWQSLLSTNSYFVGGDNQDTPNFEALKSYANFYHATYQEGYGAYLERISSGIDLGYETDGTPYLTLSTNSYSSGEFSMRLTNTQLGFYKDGKALAWFSSSKMFIPIALIRDQLIIGSNDFGGISFIPTSSGIAVTWIDSGDAVFEN